MIARTSLLLMTCTVIYAHSNSYIFVELIPDGESVSLEVTMDVGDNPLVTDNEMIYNTIKTAVSLDVSGELQPLSQFGTWRFETRTQFSSSTPALGDSGGDHELVTGVWSGKLPQQHVVLGTPARTPFDVILWSRQPTMIEHAPAWSLLICNERSPLITLSPIQITSMTMLMSVLAVLFGASGGLIIGWLRREKGGG
jgi:hypothetical protein